MLFNVTAIVYADAVGRFLEVDDTIRELHHETDETVRKSDPDITIDVPLQLVQRVDGNRPCISQRAVRPDQSVSGCDIPSRFVHVPCCFQDHVPHQVRAGHAIGEQETCECGYVRRGLGCSAPEPVTRIRCRLPLGERGRKNCIRHSVIISIFGVAARGHHVQCVPPVGIGRAFLVGIDRAYCNAFVERGGIANV